MNWNDFPPRQRDAMVHMDAMRHSVVDTLIHTDDEGFTAGEEVPHYSTDATAADAMEDELARQGLEDVYLVELACVVGASRVQALYSATPAQRCLAALRAKGIAI